MNKVIRGYDFTQETSGLSIYSFFVASVGNIQRGDKIRENAIETNNLKPGDKVKTFFGKITEVEYINFKGELVLKGVVSPINPAQVELI